MWPLQDSYFPDDLVPIAQALHHGTAIRCCDGSYMPALSSSLGATVWRLEDPTTGQFIWGTSQTSGTEQVVNAYWFELQGIYMILLGVYTMCLFCDVCNGALTIRCDCLTCIQLSQGNWLKINQNTPHTDLIQSICRLTVLLPVTIRFTHVKGHQNQEALFSLLPWLSQLNVEMDLCAKPKLLSLLAEKAPPLLASGLLHKGWSCIIDGIKVTADPSPMIQFSISSGKLQ